MAPGNRVSSVQDVYAFGESAGYPLMIKALDGGGGRGIRMVANVEGVEGAYNRFDLISSLR